MYELILVVGIIAIMWILKEAKKLDGDRREERREERALRREELKYQKSLKKNEEE